MEAAHAAGETVFEFDRTVYAEHSVKDALIAMQHAKCAFCEAKPLHVSSGDVEHFRPKAAVRQSETSGLERPGYFWLAYEWENLLFACERCNRRHKRNLFPLVDPTMRARGPSGDLAQEQPVFIDPSAEDPTPHITFRDSRRGHGRRARQSARLRYYSGGNELTADVASPASADDMAAEALSAAELARRRVGGGLRLLRSEHHREQRSVGRVGSSTQRVVAQRWERSTVRPESPGSPPPTMTRLRAIRARALGVRRSELEGPQRW
jgi:uncharacterized protein (TIGR02646 family)